MKVWSKPQTFMCEITNCTQLSITFGLSKILLPPLHISSALALAEQQYYFYKQYASIILSPIRVSYPGILELNFMALGRLFCLSHFSLSNIAGYKDLFIWQNRVSQPFLQWATMKPTCAITHPYNSIYRHNQINEFLLLLPLWRKRVGPPLSAPQPPFEVLIHWLRTSAI